MAQYALQIAGYDLETTSVLITSAITVCLELLHLIDCSRHRRLYFMLPPFYATPVSSMELFQFDSHSSLVPPNSFPMIEQSYSVLVPFRDMVWRAVAIVDIDPLSFVLGT